MNAPQCRQALQELAPAVVVVIGTRVIKAATLACISAPIINYHAGINPRYRGQHGYYWALSERDPEHAGVTVHLVDSGIDTGAVLLQARVAASRATTSPRISMCRRRLPRRCCWPLSKRRWPESCGRARSAYLHGSGSSRPCGVICGRD